MANKPPDLAAHYAHYYDHLLTNEQRWLQLLWQREHLPAHVAQRIEARIADKSLIAVADRLQA